MDIDWVISLCFLIPIVLFACERIARAFRNWNHRVGGPKVFDPCYSGFKPLTDEEFVARCKPGVKAEMALKVRSIIADQLCIPPEEIHPEHRLVEDLRAD